MALQNTPFVTIPEIESKQFRVVARGYDQREVDEFLDTICDEIERLEGVLEDMNRQLAYANAQTRKAEAAAGAVAPAWKMAEPEPVEPAAPQASGNFQDILEMAQRVKEQTIADAKMKAKEIVENAEAEATARLGSLTDEKWRLEAAVADLKRSAREYKEKFAALLASHKELLDKTDDL